MLGSPFSILWLGEQSFIVFVDFVCAHWHFQVVGFFSRSKSGINETKRKPDLLFVFEGISILLSIVAIPVYIPTNSVREFLFIYILSVPLSGIYSEKTII